MGLCISQRKHISSLILHTHININCKKCIMVVILTAFQLTLIHVPKNP